MHSLPYRYSYFSKQMYAVCIFNKVKFLACFSTANVHQIFACSCTVQQTLWWNVFARQCRGILPKARHSFRSLGVGFTDFCRRFVFAPDCRWVLFLIPSPTLSPIWKKICLNCRGIQSKRGVVERMEDGDYLLGLFLPLSDTLARFQQVRMRRLFWNHCFRKEVPI